MARAGFVVLFTDMQIGRNGGIGLKRKSEGCYDISCKFLHIDAMLFGGNLRTAFDLGPPMSGNLEFDRHGWSGQAVPFCWPTAYVD